MVVLASGRPTEGVTPVARDLALGQNGRAGAILSYHGGAIVDCGPGARILWQQVLPAPMVPALCSFAAQQNVAIVTYSPEGIVTERPQDPWAMREGFTNKLPMVGVPDLPAYVNYPVNKMLITLDPIRLRPVLQAGLDRFAGQIDLYPSSPFFIEACLWGGPRTAAWRPCWTGMGLTRDNLMACGDGMNDRSMIHYAGVGVAMANAEAPSRHSADYITAADNNHDGVAEAIERFIL